MGHGAARELSTETEIPELNPKLAPKLTEALKKLDAVDSEFKTRRDDERLAQLVKEWNRLCREMDDHLRTIAKVLVGSHQLSLDIGSDGGGIATKPFIEEMRELFPKLQFKLNEDRSIDVVAGDLRIGRGTVEDISYGWMEEMVVEWVTQSALKLAAKKGG